MRLAMLRACGAALRLTGQSGAPARLTRPKVLLIRPDHLGDVLMASPAVETLRKALPEAHLAMMVGPWAAEIASRDPLLDRVLICPFPGFTRRAGASLAAPYLLLGRTAAKLRRERFDAALVLRFDHWWGAWAAALAGIPARVGHEVAECAPFLSHRLPLPGRVHWVSQGLQVVGGLLSAWQIDARLPEAGLRFSPTEAEECQAEELWTRLRADGRGPVVAFHPGTGSPWKLWPEDRWMELGRRLASRHSRIVVTGSAAEAAAAGRIAAAIPRGRSMAGETSLGALAALFRRCDLVVGVDSGPLHLAVAVGVPTVHLFGPTDPGIFGPWGDTGRHRVVASTWPGAPCGQLGSEPPPDGISPCMAAIAAAEVVDVCERLLG